MILGVFALEELGKALIEFWRVKNEASKREFPSHVEKQSATFALLLAKDACENLNGYRDFIRQGQYDLANLGPYSEQFVWARSGFYDELRMAATYADKVSRWPDNVVKKIDGETAKHLHSCFRDAQIALRDERPMGLAAIIYQNGLGRL